MAEERGDESRSSVTLVLPPQRVGKSIAAWLHAEALRQVQILRAEHVINVRVLRFLRRCVPD